MQISFCYYSAQIFPVVSHCIPATIYFTLCASVFSSVKWDSNDNTASYSHYEDQITKYM